MHIDVFVVTAHFLSRFIIPDFFLPPWIAENRQGICGIFRRFWSASTLAESEFGFLLQSWNLVVYISAKTRPTLLKANTHHTIFLELERIDGVRTRMCTLFRNLSTTFPSSEIPMKEKDNQLFFCNYGEDAFLTKS